MTATNILQFREWLKLQPQRGTLIFETDLVTCFNKDGKAVAAYHALRGEVPPT